VIWKSQLQSNDFPPVCAMTGAPVEVWHKFKFSTTPGWAFLGGALMATALARRASGYLPLTRASLKKLRLVTWGSVGLLPLTILFWSAAAFAAPSDSDGVRSGITAVLVLLGLVSIFGFLVGLVFVRRMVGPSGIVKDQPPGYSDSLIELRRVHPVFAAEVRRLQHARAAQMAAAYQAPYTPGTWK
jgi:hypothetical protein